MSRLSLFVDREDGLGAGLKLHDPNSPLAPYFLAIGHVFLALILTGVWVVLNYVPLNHTDIWAHIRFGEQIVDSHKLLTGQTFSQFADVPSNGSNYCWLSQALFAFVFRLGQWLGGTQVIDKTASGADALRFFHATLVCSRLALLFYAFRRCARSGTIAACGLAFIAVAGIGNLSVLRPQVIAELIFAAILLPLSRAELSKRGCVLIIVAMTLWANAHGSYPIGLIILGIVCLACLIEVLTGAPTRISQAMSDSQLRRLTATILLSLVSIAVLNPEGYRIFLNTLSMAGHPNVTVMDEWQPLWAPNTMAARIAFSMCLGLVLVSVFLSRNPFRWQTWLALLAFGGQAVLHQRGVIWLFMVAPWIAMPHLGDAFTRLRPDWCVSIPSFKKTLIVGMVAFIALMWSLPLQRFTSGKKPLAQSVSDGTPWQQALALTHPDLVADTPLAKSIRAIFPDGRFTGAIYAGDTLGDYFIWQMPSPAPVYMYSHVQLFSSQQWQKYTMIRDTRDGWREELDRAKINLIVARPAVEFNICQKLRTDQSWTIVTDEANLLTKRDPRNRLFVALRKVPLHGESPH